MSLNQRRKRARKRRNQLVRAELAQLRLALRRRTPRMKSWWKKKPQWLCSIIRQYKLICWAIAFVRHYEFRLKQRGLLPLEEHLSIQDFINNTPKFYRRRDGALIVDLSCAAKVLKANGVLLERDCEFTQSLVDAPRSDPGLTRFYPTEAKVYSLYSTPFSRSHQDRANAFHSDLCKHLKGGAVAARFTVYPSYEDLKGKDIYYPTQHELESVRPFGHVVVLTKYDFDGEDRLFYQFQDSYGVETCDKGYSYVYGDLITHFLEIEL